MLAGSLVLSWVALFNRAPLVFADTISYSTAAYEGDVPGLFSIFYSAFILPLHAGVSFWPVVFVQGAILSHLMYLTARSATNGGMGRGSVLVIISVLAVFSSLPWITGEILPDVFAPVVLLGFFLIGFANHQLSRTELIYLQALTAFAIASHLSYVPLAAGLILLCVGLRVFFLRRTDRIARWTARLVLPLLLAVASLFAANILDSQSFVLSRNSNVFLLAKWIDEGPALSYLQEHCPSAGFALCEHVDELAGKSHDELKWSGDSPFAKVGTFDELEPEARAIVRGTFFNRPGEVFRDALVNAGVQFTRFEAGDGLTKEFATWVGQHVGRVYGTEVGRAFLESRQAEGELPITLVRQLHLIGLAIAAALCLWFWLRPEMLPPQFFLFFIFVFGGIVGSAVVTGALSGPYDRYLARVIWLVGFVALVGLFARRQPKPFSEPES